MNEFSRLVSEHAKTNGTVRLDFNYDSLEIAKQKNGKEVLWLQDKDTFGDDPECVVLSLEQAKWLVEELQSFIKLLEE